MRLCGMSAVVLRSGVGKRGEGQIGCSLGGAGNGRCTAKTLASKCKFATLAP